MISSRTVVVEGDTRDDGEIVNGSVFDRTERYFS